MESLETSAKRVDTINAKQHLSCTIETQKKKTSRFQKHKATTKTGFYVKPLSVFCFVLIAAVRCITAFGI